MGSPSLAACSGYILKADTAAGVSSVGMFEKGMKDPSQRKSLTRMGYTESDGKNLYEIYWISIRKVEKRFDWGRSEGRGKQR